MNILGIGGVLNDAACALLRDGQLAGAVEERKVARFHTAGVLPGAAISSCLAMGGVSAGDIDCVALARPFSPQPNASIHLQIRARFPKAELIIVDHHAAHAASAYYPSPFEEATVLTLDRAGDVRCGTRWRAAGSEMQLERDLYFPDSVADLYSRVTDLLGFSSGGDEHKVQWISATGDDRFVEVFDEMFGGGEWPRPDQSYFDRDRLGQGAFSQKLYQKLGLQDGEPIPESLKRHVAAGLQRSVEATVRRMAKGAKNVCVAGGLFMNALLVAALERDFNTFVQPAAGNAGTALGAAYHAWHVAYRQQKRIPLETLCLGPAFSAEEIKQVLENCKLRFRYLLTGDEAIAAAIKALTATQIVAWMQGRMEFGPRALGNRSILASPLNPYSTENLNVFIKHREPSRKFAASVPAESASDYFEVGSNARFLATVGRLKPGHEKTFEAAMLGGGLLRVHVVKREENPLFHRLLLEAGRVTGLPVLYNTSFNLFHDPLVCTPRDAARSFYSSGIDAMFVGNFFLQK